MKTIPLTQGYVALVDDEDYDRVAQFKWYSRVRRKKYQTTVYAERSVYPNGKRKGVSMPNFILSYDGMVDHGDKNGLNNQRHNLRPATNSQNQANRPRLRPGASRFKGVTFDKRRGKWRSTIRLNYRPIQIGMFLDEADAATAYNFKAYELFGDFACFNLPTI